jgi:hypothetical protein
MITRENIKEVITLIPKKRLNQIFDNKMDWVLLELYIFNAGYQIVVKNKYYNSKDEKIAYENGNLFMHKDTFSDLLQDLNISL